MSATESKETCQRNCWMIGGGVGLLGLLLMWLAGDYSFIASLFWGILLGVMVGLVLTYLLCGKLSGSAAAGAGMAGAAAATAHAATGGTDAESAASDTAGAAQTAAETAKTAPATLAETAADAVSAARDSAAADEVAPTAAEASEKAAALAGEVSESADDVASAAAEDAAQVAGDAASAAVEDVTQVADDVADAASPASEEADSPATDLGEDYDGDGILEGTNEGTRPEALAAPREGGADNLKEIKGVGPKMEGLLHSLGFYHFDQIANWSADEVAWVDANLQGFRGRVSRDNWVEQAKLLASGAETEFSKKVQKGGVY